MIRSLILLLAASLPVGAEPPSASSVMATAQAEASSQHKAILLVFHASWCGWCHRFDQYLEIPENKAILERYFVKARLDVQEHGDRKALENPGGIETINKVASGEVGLPFFAFLNEKGGVFVTTIRPGDAQAAKGNIGYPNKPWEIDWFMTMLRKAAPEMAPGEARVLEKSLRTRAQ